VLSKLTLQPWKQDVKRLRGCRLVCFLAIIWMIFVLVTESSLVAGPQYTLPNYLLVTHP
jgi:hypothetical protein